MNLDLNKLTCGVSLTDTEQAVLEYLLLHLDEALKLGVRGVAKANFTSTSTVMRLSRKLGYNGFIEMYYKLLGAVGEGSQSYELNEGFISHVAGEGAVSMEITAASVWLQKRSTRQIRWFLSMAWDFHP